MRNLITYGCLCIASVVALFLFNDWSTKRRLRAFEQRLSAARPESMSQGEAASPRDDSNLKRHISVRAPVTVASTGSPPSMPVERAPADESAPTPQDQMAYVDSVFGSEEYDRSWAPAVEVSLDTSIRSNAGTSSVESLQCRRSLCKARIAHHDEAGFQTFISTAFSTSRYWDGYLSSLRDESAPDGVIRTTMFFVKDGVEMPMLD